MEQKPRVKPESFEGNEPSGKSGGKLGKLGDIKTYIISGVITIALIYLMSGYVGVTTKNYNKNNTAMDGEINTINAEIKVMQTDIANIPTTVNSSVATAMIPVTTQITAIQGNVTTLQNSVSALQSAGTTAGTNVTANQNDITTIKGQVATIQTSVTALQTALGNVNTSTLQTSITALQTSLTALQTQLTADEAKIAADQTNITALQTTTTTTTTSGGTTMNNVTVSSISGNPYYSGSPVLVYPNILVGTAVTQSFSFNITNSGTAAITAEQLALGFPLYNTARTGVISLPSDAVVTVTSQGTNTAWASVSTGQVSVLGYENVIPSGIFASLGQITLAVGQTQTITLNVTVTAGTTNPIGAFIMGIQIIPLPSK